MDGSQTPESSGGLTMPQNTLRRRPLSADRPYEMIEEHEASGGKDPASVLTLFLTASECPIGCNMCDLWQNTLAGPTPTGAIPRQIDWAIRSGPRTDWIKLYNSGNFFDSRSIPESDYDTIAAHCEPYSRVVVENHPSIGRMKVTRFRDRLAGQLEIAVGLETVQPRQLARLGKRMTRDDFDRYASWLKSNGIDLRVFLIVGAPGVSGSEAIRWARLSVRHAFLVGARHISLIPARYGHGWGGRGSELPVLTAQAMEEVQLRAIEDVGGRAVVTVDLWDLARELESDSSARGSRDQACLARLRKLNLNQRIDRA